MRMCSIASGSSGNCIYVGTDTTHLLVDCGISGKRIEEGLKQLGISGYDLDGILITHEHADHIQGLGVMSRRYHLPVYTAEGTLDAINQCNLGKLDAESFTTVHADETFRIKDIDVAPMRISHDAREPLAYRFSHGRQRGAICTDLGYWDEYTAECLKGMDALYLEANHDVNMLMVGSYPYPLKQRILGNRGHLSNENAGRLLSRVLHDGTKKVFLSHLSKENNLPELAFETVKLEINLADNPYRAGDFDIQVAKRSEPSEIITF